MHRSQTLEGLRNDQTRTKFITNEYLVSFVYCIMLYFGKYFRIKVFFSPNLYILIQILPSIFSFFFQGRSYRSSHRLVTALDLLDILVFKDNKTYSRDSVLSGYK